MCRAFGTVRGTSSVGCVRVYDHVVYRVNVTVQAIGVPVCRCEHIDVAAHY
jgi:hypothetical protein